jgi:hypothetical protein
VAFGDCLGSSCTMCRTRKLVSSPTIATAQPASRWRCSSPRWRPRAWACRTAP